MFVTPILISLDFAHITIAHKGLFHPVLQKTRERKSPIRLSLTRLEFAEAQAVL